MRQRHHAGRTILLKTFGFAALVLASHSPTKHCGFNRMSLHGKRSMRPMSAVDHSGRILQR
jgi:hypothetical protein